MSSASNSILDRLYELLADRALQGLDATEASELETLLLQHPEIDAQELDRLAGTLDTALIACDAEPMPTEVRARLAQAADSWIAEGMNSAGDAESSVLAKISWAPWLIAAASLAIAATAWIGSIRSAPSAGNPPVAIAYAEFIDSAPADLIRVDWQPIAKNYSIPTGSFSGEVVWSGAEQRGYMVFEGLPPNDPSVEQFQLWIIDASRGESPPVDGGVFDVDSTGRVIVPIRATLPIGSVAAFAVTVEAPGGVVVSAQERIATLAPVGQG